MNIKQTYNKNTYNYTLLKSEQLTPKRIKALYKQRKQTLEGEIVAYEVQIIRQETVFGEVKWMNPSNEDWGSYGWTYVNEDLAESKFASI